MTVLPLRVHDVAPAGTATLARGPTAVMRLPSTTTVPSSITSSPFIVTTRAADHGHRALGHVASSAWKPMFMPVRRRIGAASRARPSRKAKAFLSSRV